MIFYHENLKKQIWIVFLNMHKVGVIKKTDKGFVYFPNKAKTGGEPFATLEECKHSLGDAE